ATDLRERLINTRESHDLNRRTPDQANVRIVIRSRHGAHNRQVRHLPSLLSNDLEPVERIDLHIQTKRKRIHKGDTRTHKRERSRSDIDRNALDLVCLRANGFEPALEQRAERPVWQVAVIHRRIEDRLTVTPKHNAIHVRRRFNCQQQTHTWFFKLLSTVCHFSAAAENVNLRELSSFSTNSKLIDKAFEKSCSTISPHSTAVMLSAMKSSSARSRNSATLERR